MLRSWPLVLLFAGFPLWWLGGVSTLLPLVLAVPMAYHLLRRRQVLTPPGFGWWLLFLVWVAVGVTVLWADAPGAVPGGGPGRLVVFVYRLAWYVACTVVLLWIGNLDQKELSTRRAVRLLGWMFVVTTLGGILGMLLPRLELTSLMEMLLPRAVSRNDFVQSLIDPRTASIQNVVGREAGRPVAPFAYANSWGSNLSLFLPFFILGWTGRDAGWRRRVAPFVLLLATVPVVYSLNRGLWACLALGVVVLAVRAALSGRVAAIATLLLGVTLAATLVLVTPLGALLVERLNNPHSNDRRGQLLVDTVTSTVTGSPVVGFGSTRDVQGSFFSIAGGATEECPACGVPPLGTQGQLWFVLFCHGVLGLAFFLTFFAKQAVRFWRGRTALQAAGTVVLVFMAVQLLVYDMQELPLYTIMITVGLMWRESRESREAALEGSPS